MDINRVLGCSMVTEDCLMDIKRVLPGWVCYQEGGAVDCFGKKLSRSLVCYRLTIRIIGIQR